jgi:bifunctional non-homologous end joining protein LigD
MTQPTKLASLYYTSGSSDKEYHAQIVPSGAGFLVNFQYGRRGGALQDGSKTKAPVALDKALAAFDALIKEKMGKGYTMDTGGQLYQAVTDKDFTGVLPQLLNEMDKACVPELIADKDWIAQEKQDGHRRMMDQASADALVLSINRKGIRVGLPLETAQAFAALAQFAPWRLDGELVGSVFHVFDVLEWGGEVTTAETVAQRLQRLEAVKAALGEQGLVRVVYTAYTAAEKQALYDKMKAETREGLVFKRLEAVYIPGRPASGGDQLKHKFVATATFIVLSHSSDRRSVQLGLTGVNRELGSVTIPPNMDIPAVSALVEIRYLYAYPDGALAQPNYQGLRTDLEVADCVESQLKFKAPNDD